MDTRLKKIIFKKLNSDLGRCEIILAENHSIWFIDRASKYWYFELEKSGKLWWRYEFFTDFFIIFDLETKDFQPLLSQWVEGILNREVVTTALSHFCIPDTVEGILNREVVTTSIHGIFGGGEVEGILNRKVVTTPPWIGAINKEADEILNCEAVTSVEVGKAWSGMTEGVLNHGYRKGSRKVEEVLNLNVVSISHGNELIDIHNQILLNDLVSNLPRAYEAENPFGYVVESADSLDTPAHDSVDEVLRYKVTRTIPDLNDSMNDIEILLKNN